jgi:hypothetical protein
MYKRQDEAGSKEIRYYISFFSVSTQKRLKQLVVGNEVLILSRRRLFKFAVLRFDPVQTWQVGGDVSEKHAALIFWVEVLDRI